MLIMKIHLIDNCPEWNGRDRENCHQSKPLLGRVFECVVVCITYVVSAYTYVDVCVHDCVYLCTLTCTLLVEMYW